MTPSTNSNSKVITTLTKSERKHPIRLLKKINKNSSPQIEFQMQR